MIIRLVDDPRPKAGGGGGQEELPHVWGKERHLHFAGAAVKRYPTSKVREIQDGRHWERTSESRQTETTITDNRRIWSHGPQSCLTQWNYAMLCGATQDGRVMVERSDRMWFTGEGNGKPLQYACLENPMNSMNEAKRQDTERWTPQVGRCPICYWRSVEK